MFSTLLTLALLATPAIQGVLADFAVNSPTLTQCQESRISWEATKGPYNLIVVSAENPCGDALADLGDHTGTTFTWKNTLPAGTKVQLSVEDADGEEAWSQTITVVDDGDNSCIPGAVVKTTSSSVSSTTKASSTSLSSALDISSSADPSTLVVTPTTTVNAPDAASTNTVITPEAVGGVGNAASNPLGIENGALTMRQSSTSVMVLGALAVVLAISL